MFLGTTLSCSLPTINVRSQEVVILEAPPERPLLLLVQRHQRPPRRPPVVPCPVHGPLESGDSEQLGHGGVGRQDPLLEGGGRRGVAALAQIVQLADLWSVEKLGLFVIVRFFAEWFLFFLPRLVGRLPRR